MKHSLAVPNNDIEYLCNCILSKNHDYDDENERLQELKKVVEFLLSKGFSHKDIKEKFLDCLKSDDFSYVKIKLLADIDSDIAMLLPLLSLPVTVLKMVADKTMYDKPYVKEFSSRILYLSHHLDLVPSQLIPILAKHPKLLIMKFSRLDSKMKALKDANISSKYIVKDLWIFNYTEGLLANRIQAAVKARIELKPWMLRCSEKFFESMQLKHSETQRILNGDSLHTYLAKKLNCSTEYVIYMMEKNKLLKSINIPKIEQIINFLYEKGYTPEEVRLFPRVFCSSIKTLQNRFEELRHVKSTLPTLCQLCMSAKKFRSSKD